jgi:hypothetical protein
MRLSWPRLGSLLVGLIGVIAGLAAVAQYVENRSTDLLSGEWIVANTVATGQYAGMRLEFRVFLTQAGKQFTGTGEKWAVDGTQLDPPERTPISIVAGAIDSDEVKATFVESGTARETRGSFAWRVVNGELVGEFSSTTGAAGTSQAVRR